MKRPISPLLLFVIAVSVLIATTAYSLQQTAPMGGPGGPRGGPPGGAPGGPPPPAAGATGTPPPGSDAAAPPSPPGDTDGATRPEVAVVTVQPAAYQARIVAYGAATPHYALTVKTPLSGRVETLAAGFEAGERLAAGATLLQLEASDYRAAVAGAEYDLAAARQALLEERREGARAKEEWRASGLAGQPDSPLVLRAPQLATAEAAVGKAETALAAAREELTRTRLTAPFDALVIERDVAPGDYLQVGAEVATLYATDRLEVSLPLSAREWGNLPDAAPLLAGEWPVELAAVEGGGRWHGRVLRADGHLDDTTRQRALVVAVDRPLEQDPPLLPGTFVHAQVAGREVAGLWRLPGSALSQRGEVWYLDQDHTLAKFAATPLFSVGEAIFVAPPQALTNGPQRVVVHPLNGYLPGLAVAPVEEKSDG